MRRMVGDLELNLGAAMMMASESWGTCNTSVGNERVGANWLAKPEPGLGAAP